MVTNTNKHNNYGLMANGTFQKGTFALRGAVFELGAPKQSVYP